MTLFKFYGPPGTGKTHRLISRAKAYVRTGTPLYKIGYFAFTRKAASEARERMPADDKKLPFFQTLHSFAYHKLGLQEENIMQPYHYEDLGKRLGIRVNYADKFNDEQTHFLTCNDPYFQMIGRAMNRDITIREEFDRNEHDKKTIRWDTLKHIHANFLEYKSKNKLYDFNDIITNVCNRKDLPIFKTIFIDEAQDLSPLQWKLYDTLKKHTTDMYLAGDDDQAIFAWAGADVSRFINEKVDKEKVLKYSKRISKAIQEQSEIPLSRISGLRKHKVYLPRNVEGSSKYITALNQVDLSKGKWLILARRKDTLLELMKELTKRNLYFETKKGKSFKVRIHKAASSYTNWTMDGMLEPKEIKNIQDYIPIGKWDPKKNWYEVFTLAPEKEVAYIRSMLENDEKLNEPARIFLSTIHAIKGGEEANVILSLELGNKIIKSMRRSKEKSDEEHRVWYVAITRGKNNLYKLKAKIARKGYPL
jgi:DNA helicase-2/ATP-dependent DNA helicase PcrA|tara:strand:+ start:366 stop:1796 length:1431 start_codon:yes stop_codon:yes gene_type:complete